MISAMIKLVVVGKMKNRALESLCADYFVRLSHFDRVEITEIKDSDIETEATKMLEILKNFRGRIYAMGEEGKTYTSVEFSKMLERDAMRGGSAFVIGGAYGLSARIKTAAHGLISLSPLTFTHEFARAILAEQLYRAKTITANTGYHHI